MAGFGDLVKKAFYLGVGTASYAGEKAGETLKDLQSQAQTIVNELVARGEITAEEAQRLVNDMVNRAQDAAATSPDPLPRPIEILDDDGPSPTDTQTETLRAQVATLRQELDNLKQKSSS